MIVRRCTALALGFILGTVPRLFPAGSVACGIAVIVSFAVYTAVWFHWFRADGEKA